MSKLLCNIPPGQQTLMRLRAGNPEKVRAISIEDKVHNHGKREKSENLKKQNTLIKQAHNDQHKYDTNAQSDHHGLYAQ
jgi:hypothetical protein